MARRQSTLRTAAAALLGSCTATALRNAARRATQIVDDALAPSGLSAAQVALMAQIAAAADDTLGALAKRAGIDASTLSRNLRGLERDGLVEIVTAESDLRRRAVWLTETGARRLEAALPLWRAGQARVTEAMGPVEIAGKRLTEG